MTMLPFSQYDAHGHLRHLITLEGMTSEQVRELLDRAQRYLRRPGEIPAHGRSLAGITVGNIFTEPSTRTRSSFELAAKRLGADVLNLEIQLSSRVKGETVLDTVYTLQAMAVDVFVIRDAEPGVCQYVAEHVAPHVSVLSAGEAHLSHPTQGLLDALTILQYKGGFRDLVVAVVGDVRHSRVARSAYQVFTALEVGELRIVAPDALMPDEGEMPEAKRFKTLESGIEHADVVMMLRIQKERMAQAAIPDAHDYFARWGVTKQKLKLARPEAIVMHPGPMNREIEIASEVADGPHSVIRQQVTNGVAVRMAVLETVIENRNRRWSPPR
ncbi:MAG: aspartate carbamoyltransferase catalytic subunit [Pseudomonadota bacterium]